MGTGRCSRCLARKRCLAASVSLRRQNEEHENTRTPEAQAGYAVCRTCGVQMRYRLAKGCSPPAWEITMRFEASARKYIVAIPLYSESDGCNLGEQCTIVSKCVDDGRWMMYERPVRLRATPICHFAITRLARMPTRVTGGGSSA
jgi:hypothetical protein